jgi:hypothetical protein
MSEKVACPDKGSFYTGVMRKHLKNSAEILTRVITIKPAVKIFFP